MFFQSMNQMMTLTWISRWSSANPPRDAWGVGAPEVNTLKDEAQNSIVPLTLNGTPEELDSGFMQVVARPMQKASGLISNMAQFEAQANKAASSSKGAKEAKRKNPKRTGRSARSMKRISRRQRSISPPRDTRRLWTRLPRHASTPNPTT